MTRIRLIFVSLLAAVAASAVASASASAAPCALEAEKVGLCISLEAATAGAHAFTATGLGKSLLEVLTEAMGGVEFLHIECGKLTGTGQFNVAAGGGLLSTPHISKLKLSFSECTTLQAGCKVTEPIVIEGVAGEGLVGTISTSLTDVVFKPGSGTTFGEVVVTGCESKLVNGKYVVKGEQLCEISEPEADIVEHLLECFETGSTLTAAGKKALFNSGDVDVKLTGEQFWNLYKG